MQPVSGLQCGSSHSGGFLARAAARNAEDTASLQADGHFLKHARLDHRCMPAQQFLVRNVRAFTAERAVGLEDAFKIL
jgi:hypothetical protein